MQFFASKNADQFAPEWAGQFYWIVQSNVKTKDKYNENKFVVKSASDTSIVCASGLATWSLQIIKFLVFISQ